jgi:hypothetical protein
LFLAIFFFPVLSSGAKAKDGAPGADSLSDDSRAVLGFMLQMETGAPSRKLLSRISSIAKRSKDESARIRALALLSQYKAEVKGDAVAGLAALAPYILPKDLSEKFAASAKKAGGGGKTSGKKNVPDFPDASKWRLDHPELCVSAGLILLSRGKYVQALSAFDRVGRKIEDVPRVLAAEGIGDTNFSLKRFQASVDAYKFALKVLGTLRKQTAYGSDEFLPVLEKRIRGKLADALAALDAERYGPGFVAYREARGAEFAKKYPLAAALYKRLEEGRYPGGPAESEEEKKGVPHVYAEAAVLYGAKCLFHISRDKKGVAAAKAAGSLKAGIAARRQLLKKYGKAMLPRVRARIEKNLARDESLLKDMEAVPHGKKAAEAAVAGLDAFVAGDELGLYRGEALAVLGDHYLEDELDVDKAQDAHMRCYRWLGKSSDLRAALAKSGRDWSVPPKAAGVAAPPAVEKRLAGWSQWIEKARVAPGAVVNRNSCPWYLDSLRAWNGKILSLCFFIKGDGERALKALKAIVKYEPLENAMWRSGRPNSYSRLLGDYGRGHLRALPEEIALYKGRLRTALLLGDFYYETEDMDRCLAIRKALADGVYGRLNSKQRSSALYKLAEALNLAGRSEDVPDILRRASAEAPVSPVSDEIYMALGNLAFARGDRSGYEESAELYARALRTARGLKREMALCYFAEALRECGRGKEALATYKKLLKLNPGTCYGKICEHHIGELERSASRGKNTRGE